MFVLATAAVPGDAEWSPLDGLSPPPSFVYRPGGVAGGNVYTDTASLRLALNASQGRRVLLCDNSLAPVQLDAGTYGDADVVVMGALGTTGEMTVAEGAVIPALEWVAVDVTWEGTTPVATFDDGQKPVLIRSSFARGAAAGGPMWRIADAATLVGTLQGTNLLEDSGPLVELGAASFLVLTVEAVSIIGDDVFAGPASGFLVLTFATISSAVGGVQPSYSGVFSPQRAGYTITFLANPLDLPSSARVVGAGGGFTVNLPAAVDFPLGDSITVVQFGPGVVTIAPAAGDTINGVAASITTTADNSSVTLTLVATFLGAPRWIITNREP